MSSRDIKKSLHQTIDGIQDENFLKALYTMLSEFLTSASAGSIGEKSLTKADILRRCLEAEGDIREGRVFTASQLKEKIRTGFGTK
jgi:hypothetical protein